MIAQQTAKRGGGRIHELDADAAAHSVIIELLEELAVHQRTPSRSAVRREFLVALELSMSKIAPQYREVIRMRYIEGLSLQETAERMSKTTDSAQKLCSRGLGLLRLELRSMSRYM
jgi:RNA polymerase sigma factor (sigma-70 family)